MPCHVEESTGDIWREAKRDAVHNSVPAELLCELLTNNPRLASSSQRLEDWWIEHQQRDKRKKAREEKEHRVAVVRAQEAVKEAAKKLNELLSKKKGR